MPNDSVSFVVQGAPDTFSEAQVAAIKKYFPTSPVILSSCGKIFSRIRNADIILENPDPGFFYYSDRPGEKQNNINRQIVNTLAGLKACQTEYAFKLRTDFELTGRDFIKFFDRFNKTDKAYQLFSHKLLACCYFSRNPKSNMPYLFHPSDVAFYGKTTDLIKLFDIPLMSRKEAFWDTNKSRFNRYVPEQYLFINALRQNGFDPKCDFYNDTGSIEDTGRFFASNFIFLSFADFNLRPKKQVFNVKVHPNAFKSCYTHLEWQRLYQTYVDATHSVPLIDKERIQIEQYYDKYKKYRFLANLCALPFHGKAKRRAVRNKILEYFLDK